MSSSNNSVGIDEPVQIKSGDKLLDGDLAIPAGAAGLVLFAHGSGSSRFSLRNRQVAAALRERGLATLLMDLLTAEEEAVDMYTRHLRFNISMLAERVVAALEWLEKDERTHGQRLGIFGASTGAAAALMAAAARPESVGAVVSRGGRPDLAAPVMGNICVPTLLIVGGADTVVIDLNREALAQLRCEKQIEIIPGATHLFEEHGALEQVSRSAGDWFTRYLVPEAARPPSSG